MFLGSERENRMVAYKKNKRSLIIKPPAEAKKIITPVEAKLTYSATNQQGKPVYIVEVPDCRFNGLPISLFTRNKTEVPKVHFMVKEFCRWYHEVALKHGSQI